MPEIVFVDVQDKSGLNQKLIRRHAAEATHREKRLIDVFRHRDPVPHQRPLVPWPAQTARSLLPNTTLVGPETEEESAITQVSVPPRRVVPSREKHRKQVRDPKTALTLRWRAGRPTAIKPPSDDLKIEYVLSESFNWMLGQYASSWSSSVRRDPRVFDLNGEVEILREAFFIVTDLLEVQQTSAAFAVLGHTLDAIPAIFRDPHPELLFTLVELAYGINMTGAMDLQAQIRPHVAELASTIMGTKHPLTTLLKSEFDATLQTHVTELVFKCIIDAMSKTFGKVAYQTLVQQMGRSQFYARTGRSGEAQRIIAEIQQQWQEQYGTDSALARLAELELCLMRFRNSPHADPSLEAQANNAMLRIEVMSGVYSNKFTDRPSDSPQAQQESPLSMAVAQWFLQNKRYTFALHCYGRAKRRRVSGGPANISKRPLADLITDSVTSAMSGALSRPGSLIILSSQAPAQDSVPAIS